MEQVLLIHLTQVEDPSLLLRLHCSRDLDTKY